MAMELADCSGNISLYYKTELMKNMFIENMLNVFQNFVTKFHRIVTC